MYYNCELLIGGLVYPVAEYIKNWDEIEVSFKRNDYDGVIRSFSNSFEFVKGARKLLIDEYKKNYLKSSANVVIYTRNNSWTWTERFRCALNFSTLKDDGFTLSINATDDSVAALIKAKKGTQYEYPIELVKEPNPLKYDGLSVHQKVGFICGGTDKTPEGYDSGIYSVEVSIASYGLTLPLYYADIEYNIKKSISISDVKCIYEAWDNKIPQGTYFIRCERSKNIHIKMNFTMQTSSAFLSTGTLVAELRKRNGEVVSTLYHEEVDVDNTMPEGGNINITSLVVDLDAEYSLNSNDELYWVVGIGNGKYNELVGELIFTRFSNEITWYDRLDAVNLDVIRPNVLLNNLLKSINGGSEGLTGIIVPSTDKRLDNCMILAAESCKKYPNAKIYTSFTKFADWMSSVFGYAYDINDKVITFRPRKDYFSNDVVKVISDYNSYNMSVNPSLIYSQLNIGYEKQDYESVNGKDEFRFTNIYNTGNTITDNRLEMISPYRADAYGIEFLAQKIGEDTTDNSSDNTVFFVCANLVDGKYILDRSESIEGVISSSTMFNAMYSPSSMIEANKEYLGGFMTDLSFASSEGNTNISINGYMENRDLTLKDGLFSVGEVEIETSDIELPEDMTGIVTFEHQSEVLQGYYKNADFSYSKTKSSKITLILKK
ncbi:MAG: hypothetical protein J6Q61_09505 [Bacteroidales bacterium]|nr:hypothetical protein [Bacteroidales bacterium]